MNPGIWQYLSPDNPVASFIVGVLKFVFFLWCLGLTVSGLWLWVKRREMSKCEDVETLVKARQERPVEKEADMRIASGPSVPKSIVQKQQTPRHQEPQHQETQNDLIQTKESAVQTFCRLYNAAVEDSNRGGEFMQRYQPIRIRATGIRAANAIDRGRDLSQEPDFQTSPYGDYYAVAIEGDTLYAVVPRLNVTFQSIIYGPGALSGAYGPGAMGQVFECPNYNPQLRYPRVKVVKPAFFEPDPAKQRWTLKEKGELDLGQGE